MKKEISFLESQLSIININKCCKSEINFVFAKGNELEATFAEHQAYCLTVVTHVFITCRAKPSLLSYCGHTCIYYM